MDAVRSGRGQFLAQERGRRIHRRAPLGVGLEGTDSLLQRLFERPADGHHFPDGLHLRSERGVRPRKLFELPLGDFHHHIINRRLERRRGFPRDVVGNFVEGHAHGEPRGDLGDGESRRFAGQRRAARHARVHFDHHHASGLRVNGKLNIRSSGFHAHFPDDGRRGVAHVLVFLVGQGLRRSDGDGVAGVHAHGVEIFNRADDHEVVAEVAHHLQLEFFPAEDGLLHQRLVHRAGVERGRNGFRKFFAVIGDRTAGAAERERRANHHGIAQLVAQAQGILRVVHQRRCRHVETHLAAGVLEPQPVFGDFDGAQRRANHLDVILFQNAGLGQLDGEIQSRLPADGGQERIRPFEFDNFFQIGFGEGLDVGAVGELRVGHDRGGVGIHQNDFVALGAQRLARLRARIVELAGLADNDRPRADNQNLLDVFALRHAYSAISRPL